MEISKLRKNLKKQIDMNYLEDKKKMINHLMIKLLWLDKQLEIRFVSVDQDLYLILQFLSLLEVLGSLNLELWWIDNMKVNVVVYLL